MAAEPAPAFPELPGPRALRRDRPAVLGDARWAPAVVAIDGTGLLVRCERAARRNGLHTSDGIPTGALVAFAGAVARKLRVSRPSYAVIAWDGADSRAWRRELWPSYKANRPAQWEDSHGLQQAMEFCAAAGISQVTVPGFEADDVLAAVQRSVTREMPDAVLDVCTEDKDLLQLTGDAMTVVTAFSSDAQVTDKAVRRDWGVPPWWLPCLRALAGDPSDNIPGLKNIGTWRAAVMLRNSGFMWPLPEHLLPGEEDRDNVLKWRAVMELVAPPRFPEDYSGTDVFKLSGRAEWHREVSDSLLDFFGKYELSSLSERLRTGRLW